MLTSAEINAFVENGYVIRKNALSTTPVPSDRRYTTPSSQHHQKGHPQTIKA